MAAELFGFGFALFAVLFWSLPTALYFLLKAAATGRATWRLEVLEARKYLFLRASNRAVAESFFFVYVLTRRMALCGRLPERTAERVASPYRPAVFSPYRLYQRCRLGIASQAEVELEFCAGKSLKKWVALLLKTWFAAFFFPAGEPTSYREKVELLGVEFDNLTMERALRNLDEIAAEKSGKTIFFVNPHAYNLMNADPGFKAVMRQADFRYPDGSGIVMASRMAGTPLLENVNGTDLFPRLCELAVRRSYRIYLLGGRPGVAAAVRDKMLAVLPELQICGVRDGYFDRKTQSGEVISAVNAAGTDILLVAFGMPLQEHWLIEHKTELNVPLRMAVGGLFDFYSGRIRRAPVWVREIGMEWVFRLLMEPQRMWRRYLVGNPKFLLSVRRSLKKRSR